MDVFYMTPEVDIPKVFNQVADHVSKEKDKKRALLIEGLALSIIQMDPNMEKFLVLLAPHLHSVVCCRVTPK